MFIQKKIYYKLYGVLYISLALTLGTSLISYDISDSSFNVAIDYLPGNLLGSTGAYIADLVLQYLGISAAVIVGFLGYCGLNLFFNKEIRFAKLKVICVALSVISLAIIIDILNIKLLAKLPSGMSGAVGQLLNQALCKLMPVKSYRLAILIPATLICLLFVFNYRFKLNFTNMLNKARVFVSKKKTVLKDKDIAPTIGVSDKKSEFTLPDINFLNKTVNQNIKPETIEHLHQYAQQLLQVLRDFGVKGEIIDIHQGPVVTLYEFEPAAGTKSSRVIGLADDIARSLSAVSTRISVIPGRNVLGIELPNKQRMFFNLHELVKSKNYNGYRWHNRAKFY